MSDPHVPYGAEWNGSCQREDDSRMLAISWPARVDHNRPPPAQQAHVYDTPETVAEMRDFQETWALGPPGDDDDVDMVSY